MLTIGHRGAKGLQPENTVAALRAGLNAGADWIECDVRLSRDDVPVLAHDASLWRLYRNAEMVSNCNLRRLQELTKDTQPIATLEEALDVCAGKTVLNIEIKSRGAYKHILPLVQKYVPTQNDWQQFVFSSFSPAELHHIRTMAPHARLALLHRFDPFVFLRHHKRLNLYAVGFHWLQASVIPSSQAHSRGLIVYAYTVNDRRKCKHLAKVGIDGIVTDRPDLMRAADP